MDFIDLTDDHVDSQQSLTNYYESAMIVSSPDIIVISDDSDIEIKESIDWDSHPSNLFESLESLARKAAHLQNDSIAVELHPLETAAEIMESALDLSQKTTDKQATISRKALEKEERKRQKQQEREDKQREKQRLKEIEIQNKLIKQMEKNANKVHKKYDCTKEMTVIVSTKLDLDYGGPIRGEIIKAGASYKVESLPLEYGVIWTRNTTRKWLESENRWASVTPFHQSEDTVLVFLKAADACDMIISKSLNRLVSDVCAQYPDCTIILLIECLFEYFKKQIRATNAIKSKLLRTALLDEQIPKKLDQAIDTQSDWSAKKNLVEDELLYFQDEFYHQVKIHLCKPDKLSVWIRVFTEQLALVPELTHRADLELRFCDNVKSGKDYLDTYIKILSEIPSVTIAKAQSIAQKYPNFSSLYKALEQQGIDAILNIPAQQTCAKIGSAVANNILRVILSNDPTENAF